MLPSDAWECVGEWCDARAICRLAMASRWLHDLRERLVRGRVMRMCECVFLRSVDRTWVTGGMSAIDLARVEACVTSPIGACVCCLKLVPVKLGARCVECVGQEQLAFRRGSATARRCEARCRTSHSELVYTCPICDFSSCLECLCANMSCGLCHMSLHPRLSELLLHLGTGDRAPATHHRLP